MIHRYVLAGSALLLATAAFAASPIADRQAIMKSFGGATKPLAAMMKGEKPFSLDEVKKSLAVYAEGNAKFVTLFPAGSD
ncbi:MAG: cytochrome c, partial [Alphaproteobacteria bacterium]|nr:cytochrome c [Alphaproteobacteria bacterium]